MNMTELSDKEIYELIEAKCPGFDCEICELSHICSQYVNRGLRYATKFDESGKCIEKSR